MTAYSFILQLKDYASSELKRVKDQLGLVDREAQKASGGLGGLNTQSKALRSTWESMKGMAAGLFAGAVVFGFTQQVMDATAEYEKFDAVLTNAFQSKDMSESAMSMIADFAKNTPFQLNEVTDSYIKLVNRGMTPTYKELTNLGDLASSQGKRLDQLTEALLDAQTGEFERLKEFGIRASKSGDQVAFTFKGVTKEVALNDEAIKDVMMSYGQMIGVSGTMSVISQTLGGRMSNLKDQFWSFLVQVGKAARPAFEVFFNLLSTGITYTQSFVLGLISVVKWIVDNRPLLIGLGVLIAGIGLQFIIANASTIGYSVALGILNGMVWLSTAAMSALNLVMSLNPISIVIIAIGALIAIVAVLWNKFGWLRGSVLGVWEVLKGFGDIIKNYVISRFKELLSGVQGIGAALVAFFNGDFKKAWDIGKKSAGELIGIESKAKAFNDAKNLGKNFSKGWDEGMKDVATPKKTKGSLITPKVPALGTGVAGTGDDKKKDKKKKSDGIVSGGSKQTQINITIGKLQDKTEIHVSSTDKGVNDLGERVQEMLLRAINSVNQIQS